MRILLVEDDVDFATELCKSLREHQYTVDWVKNGIAALSAIQSEHFDLLVLDIKLPKLSGDEVLKTIRAKNLTIPVIILTAQSTIGSRIKGFDYGADDYVVKPFNLEELCARIRAVRRRAISSTATNLTLTVAGISLDPATRMVFSNGEMVELSRREFVLLQALMENTGKIVTRTQATQVLYGWGYDISSNSIEVHIHNLRKKLKCKLIKTIRGVGYLLKDK